MPITREQGNANRYTKVNQVFGGFAPFWLINDKYRVRDDSFFFDIVYQNPVHGWVNQHIRYDTFNDVLYRMGERRMSEEAILLMREEDSFVLSEAAASTPNNPGNRL